MIHKKDEFGISAESGLCIFGFFRKPKIKRKNPDNPVNPV